MIEIRLPRECDTHCGIPEFYKMVNEHLGVECEEVDPRLYSVSEDIADDIFAYYDEQNVPRMVTGMRWVSCGPKCKENLPRRTVVVDMDLF